MIGGFSRIANSCDLYCMVLRAGSGPSSIDLQMTAVYVENQRQESTGCSISRQARHLPWKTVGKKLALERQQCENRIIPNYWSGCSAMRLNKSTSHAIRILIDCAQAGEDLVKAADISRRLDITPQNTFKIVHLLSRAGFIEAVRGRHGGVKLAQPAAEIRIGHVVRAMESMAIEIEGDRAAGSTRHGASGINQILDDALEAFISVLDQYTLLEMAKGKAGPLGGPSSGKAKKKGKKASSTVKAVPIPASRKRQTMNQARVS